MTSIGTKAHLELFWGDCSEVFFFLFVFSQFGCQSHPHFSNYPVVRPEIIRSEIELLGLILSHVSEWVRQQVALTSSDAVVRKGLGS